MLQVGLVAHDIAKNFPAEIALLADVKETLRALQPVLAREGGAAKTRSQPPPRRHAAREGAAAFAEKRGANFKGN